MMKTATPPTVDELQAGWEQARDRRNAAAVFLANELVIRSEDPFTDERANAAHLEELKKRYRAAHVAERAAREAFEAAW